MNQRLIAFGDSSTRGEGLADVWVPHMKETVYTEKRRFSKLAWPSLVANKLGLKCVNLGSGGASNREIAVNIMNFKFLPTDIVCVLWTFPERDYIYKHPLKVRRNRGSYKEAGLKMSPKQADRMGYGSYYKDWVIPEDRDLDTVMFMNFARAYVLDRAQIYAAYTYVDLITEEFSLPDHTQLIKPDWPNIVDQANPYDYHPGMRTHDLWTKEFIRQIKRAQKKKS